MLLWTLPFAQGTPPFLWTAQHLGASAPWLVTSELGCVKTCVESAWIFLRLSKRRASRAQTAPQQISRIFHAPESPTPKRLFSRTLAGISAPSLCFSRASACEGAELRAAAAARGGGSAGARTPASPRRAAGGGAPRRCLALGENQHPKPHPTPNPHPNPKSIPQTHTPNSNPQALDPLP